METQKLVSCVIPTYKRSNTLKRAITSVLCQTYRAIEVLVVDDNEKGSKESEDVAKVINNIKDNRVHLILQEKHINGAEARNAGVRASKGDFIAFLDDDDEWAPTKIEKQMDILSDDATMDGVSCLYHELRNGIVFHSCPPYCGDNLHLKIFQRQVAVFTSTILLRKNALLKSGLFDVTLKRHQDLQLLLDFTKEHSMYVINEYLVYLHSDSEINRPSYEKLVQIKQDFFKSVNSHLSIYSPYVQRTIKGVHHFELAFAAMKEKKYLKAISHFAKVGLNLDAYKLLLRRMKDRHYIALQK